MSLLIAVQLKIEEEEERIRNLILSYPLYFYRGYAVVLLAPILGYLVKSFSFDIIVSD